MNEPKSVESVWPHEESVLFLTDSDTHFGEPVSDLISQSLDCKHLRNKNNHLGNDLSAGGHQFTSDMVAKESELIPNSLLFVHCDLLIDTRMSVYVEGTTFPRPAKVVAVVDNSKFSNPSDEVEKIRASFHVAHSKSDLLEEAEDYFRTICPECNGKAARRWVLSWREGVYHRVEN